MPFRLDIDKTGKHYIKIWTCDSAGNLTGCKLPEILFPSHVKEISPMDGNSIGINKKGGLVAGLKVEYEHIIPYTDIVVYNNSLSVPSFSVIYTDLYNCVVAREEE